MEKENKKATQRKSKAVLTKGDSEQKTEIIATNSTIKREKQKTPTLAESIKQRTIENKKKMIEALQKSLGLVSPAIRTVGIERTTHYEWVRTDFEYAERVAEIKESRIDFVEGKLSEAINNLNPTLIMFYLNRHAKSRGYGRDADIVLQDESGKVFKIVQNFGDRFDDGSAKSE